jgi:hypothetical protein
MTSRWKRFYEKQMEDEKLRALVETELENLQSGVQIAKLRKRARLRRAARPR